jgi:hypothetical protein
LTLAVAEKIIRIIVDSRRMARVKVVLSRIFAIVPELAIFVFVGVCVKQVLAKGGPVKHLVPLVFVLAVDIYALFRMYRRKP